MRPRVPWLGLAVLAGGLAAWEALSRSVPGLGDYVPPASRVLLTLGGILANGELAAHVRASLVRFAGGYALAAALGVGAG